VSRIVFEQLALFLAPFAIFAIYLLLRRRNPLTRAPWDGRTLWLAVAGLGLIVAVMVFTGLTQKRAPGGYMPPRFENGQLKPGGFQ